MTHEPIRKALAALESASILSPARRIELDNFYAECNPEAIAALLADLDRVTRERDALRLAGAPLATAAYNIAQHEGRPLLKHECDSLRAAYKRWDAALGDVGV